MDVLLLLIIAAAIAIAFANSSKMRGRKGRVERPRAKAPVTQHEQGMYFRLKDALPDHVVLAQVAFSALLTARAREARNRFDRKVADFVICTKAFDVVAIVELDDKSHRGKEVADAARDRLLIEAGYRVLRYPRIPDIAKVQNDILRAPIAS